MKTLDTPLFVKTHDFILWLLKHSARFPKYLRATLTVRLENAAFDFQQQIHAPQSLLGRLIAARAALSPLRLRTSDLRRSQSCADGISSHCGV